VVFTSIKNGTVLLHKHHLCCRISPIHSLYDLLNNYESIASYFITVLRINFMVSMVFSEAERINTIDS